MGVFGFAFDSSEAAPQIAFGISATQNLDVYVFR